MNGRGSRQHRNKQPAIWALCSLAVNQTGKRQDTHKAAPVQQTNSTTIGGKESTRLEGSTRYQTIPTQPRFLQWTSFPADESTPGYASTEGNPTAHLFHMEPLQLIRGAPLQMTFSAQSPITAQEPVASLPQHAKIFGATHPTHFTRNNFSRKHQPLLPGKTTENKISMPCEHR